MYNVNAIEFDFSDSIGHLDPWEQEQIVKNCLGCWEASDDDDLIEEITTSTGWCIKSIDYDSKDIVGYIVPYHAHSDFIQLGAELGVIGFLLYLGIFLLAIYYVFIIIRFSKISIEGKVFLLFMLM